MGNVLKDSVSLAWVDRGRYRSTDPNTRPFGTNTNHGEYFSQMFNYIDLMARANVWQENLYPSGTGDTGGTFPLDSTGWPTSLDTSNGGAWNTPASGDQIAKLVVSFNGLAPLGAYLFQWLGEGTVEVRLGGGPNGSGSGVNGSFYHTVTAGHSFIYVRILETNPANPVREIKAILPGFETAYAAGDRLHPQWKVLLQDWPAGFRCMDLQNTNNNFVSDWADRTTPADFSQAVSPGGMSLEFICQLANEIESKPWFCIPHLFTDSAVTSMANFIKLNLDGDFYIEYTNEAWNNSFAQTHWMDDRGDEEVPHKDRHQYYGKRAAEVMVLFEAEFGGTSRMTRVIANQHRNPSNGRKSMDVLYDDVNPASDHFDAYSTAPYFQYKPAYPYDVNWTVADIDEAFDVIALDFPDIYENMVECKADADARGLDFVAYEGGQHILASGGDENIPALVNLFHTMQRDDRMQQLMKELFENWRELAGGGVFMHYTHVAGYGKFTYWGIHEQFYALANVNPKSRQLYVEIGVPQPTNFIPST